MEHLILIIHNHLVTQLSTMISCSSLMLEATNGPLPSFTNVCCFQVTTQNHGNNMPCMWGCTSPAPGVTGGATVTTDTSLARMTRGQTNLVSVTIAIVTIAAVTLAKAPQQLCHIATVIPSLCHHNSLSPYQLFLELIEP